MEPEIWIPLLIDQQERMITGLSGGLPDLRSFYSDSEAHPKVRCSHHRLTLQAVEGLKAGYAVRTSGHVFQLPAGSPLLGGGPCPYCHRR